MSLKVEGVVKLATDNIKGGKWLFFEEDVEYKGQKYLVRMKTFCRWVQILQVAHLKTTVNETKTNREFSQNLTKNLEHMLECCWRERNNVNKAK